MQTFARQKVAAVALSIAMLLATFATFPLASALAEQSGPKVTVTQASRDGGEVTITGSGFATNGAGIYVAVAPSTVPEFYGHSDEFVGADPGVDFMESKSTIWLFPPKMKGLAGAFAQAQPLGEDGSFTVTMNVPAFEEGKSYVVLTTKAHGQGKSDKSNDTRTAVEYEPEAVAPVQPEPTEPAKPTEPSEPAKPAEPSQPVSGATVSNPEFVNGCPQPKETVEVKDDPMAEMGLMWGIDQLFSKYASENNLKMRTRYGAAPLAGQIMFTRNLTPKVEGNTLSMTWGSGLDFVNAEGKKVLSMVNPRIVVNSNHSGEVYLTLEQDGRSQEVHLGHLRADAFIGQSYNGFEMLRIDNGKVQIVPEAAGALPGLSVNSQIPDVSLRYYFYDPAGRGLASSVDKAESYKAVWNLTNNCGNLVWMNRYITVTPKAKPAEEPKEPEKPYQISVEEENKSWKEPAAQDAAPGELRWGIKQSWRGYIGGGKLLEGVTYDGSSYVFHNGKVVSQGEDGSKVVQYEGKLHFEAYGGLLYLTFSDPQVRIDKDGNAQLWFKEWFYKDGVNEREGDYFHAVNLGQKVNEEGNIVSSQNNETYLTQRMADIFIFAYRKGLRMSNVSFAAEVPVAEKPAEPVVPTEPSEPAKPAEPSKPAKPAEPSKPAKPAEPSKPAKPAEPSKPAKPAEPSKPAKPAEPSEPAKPAEPSEPAKPAEPSEPAKPAEPSEPAKPAEPSEPAKPAEQPAAPAASAKPVAEKPADGPRSVLPRTGAEALGLLGLAAALTAAGTGAIAFARRRQH